jgi:hypothetical protein
MATEYIWFKKGKESRRTADKAGEKPTVVKLPNGVEIKYSYYTNKVKYNEEYYQNGKKHRDGDKPAHISYNRDGSLDLEEYYQNGVNTPPSLY